MSQPRLRASQLILPFLENKEHINHAARQDARMEPLTRELVLGVYRHLTKLDFVIKQLANRAPDHATKSFLLPAIYELLFLDGTPDHAVVNETMNGAKQVLKPGQQKFLNGVLRNCGRRRDALLQALQQAPAKIQRSHPGLLLKQWAETYSEDQIETICTWNNTRAPLTLRYRDKQENIRTYLHGLHDAQIDAELHPDFGDEFLVFQPGIAVSAIHGFAQGAFYVQDPSTIQAPRLLAAQPGERILDLCAAPGGKTIVLADDMQDQGEIIAIDQQADRMKLLEQNLNRTGCTCVSPLVANVLELTGQPGIAPASFDGILLDAPCSNTGVLRRRPEARWRYSPDSIKQLNRLQTQLLDACVPLLKPGGRLVYSTCSIEPAENATLINQWRAHHPQLELVEQHTQLPGEKLCDGGFSALMRHTG